VSARSLNRSGWRSDSRNYEEWVQARLAALRDAEYNSDDAIRPEEMPKATTMTAGMCNDCDYAFRNSVYTPSPLMPMGRPELWSAYYAGRKWRARLLKAGVVPLLIAAISVTAQTNFDWPVLCEAIRVHEHSVRFPYGCEHRVHGRLVGFPAPVARERCLALCERAWSSWTAGGRRGPYLAALNRVYAADTNWWVDVQKIYLRMELTKNRLPATLPPPVGKESGDNDRKPRTK